MSAQAPNVLLEQLRATMAEAKPNLAAAKGLLTQLKIILTTQSFLASGASTAQQQLSRDTLELGAKWALASQDVEAFERYYSQLRAYYTDFSATLQPSAEESKLTGLHLLTLLTQNRIAEFHIFLESLPTARISEDPCIRYVVSLEQALMEGAYNRVLANREGIPCPEYYFFLGLLEETIREEIAMCAEKSYKSLSLADAANLLSFANVADVTSFAQSHGWHIDPATQTIRFGSQEDMATGIPAKEVISMTLGYAQELESIV